MDRDSLTFDSCAFLASLFLLHTGAVLFTTNTAILARRCGIPQAFVALLTAGAEWEEKRPTLALGNVVGASISNVTGAFSLRILFNQDTLRFDISAKIYSGVLVVVSTLFAIIAFTELLDFARGVFFIFTFPVYIASICLAIYDGILAPTPKEGEADAEKDLEPVPIPNTNHQVLHISIDPSVLQCHPTENSHLLPTHSQPSAPVETPGAAFPSQHFFSSYYWSFRHAHSCILAVIIRSLAFQPLSNFTHSYWHYAPREDHSND
ncbi:uncharacterized protein RAG0_00005 [Rhynchosporium agropyri]|uniref:Sodium/calcium exchanger membrane region domain-containing protein n=1 Tax=Rhynchosporium agropyri TaxID=914238 RepID=A0A1E1JR23_9HELO|nr:uncharacterized protein RAG0_00005 [Rhynchosporium agropyri]